MSCKQDEGCQVDDDSLQRFEHGRSVESERRMEDAVETTAESESLDATLDAAIKSKRFKCVMCTFRAADNAHLRRHNFRLHTAKLKPVVCVRTFCNKEFPALFEEIEHRSFCCLQCPKCQKSFTRQAFFDRHMRSHTVKEIKIAAYEAPLFQDEASVVSSEE